MKKNVLTTILIAISLFVSMSVLMAQPHTHHKHRHGGKKQLEQVATYNGSIAEWTHNDDFIYDGLYLKTGETNLFVKFPAHLGQQIRSLGNNISVNGVLRYTPEGRQELKMVSISAKGQIIYDQKPSRRTIPAQEIFTTGSAKVKEMQANKKGEACGYILDNSVVLRIPPHIALQLSQMVQIGSTIGYTGIEKETKEGEAKAQNYKIIRSQTISVNGTQYMVK